MIVYEITNRANGKRYIGVTSTSLSERLYHHRSFARAKGKTALAGAMRKYGEPAFEMRALASLLPGKTEEDLFDLEREIIAQEGVIAPYGYNLTSGGGGLIGYKFSDKEVQRRRSYRASPETRVKMSAAQRGCGERMAPETRALVVAAAANANRGRKRRPDEIEKIRNGWSAERRADYSARMKRLHSEKPNFCPSNRTPEQRARHAEACRAAHSKEI